MNKNKSLMKIPELMVYFKILLIGFVLNEVFIVAFYLGKNISTQLVNINLCVLLTATLVMLFICIKYAYLRGVIFKIIHIFKSYRIDLMVIFIGGVVISNLLAPQLTDLHSNIINASPFWGVIPLIFLWIFLSAIIREYLTRFMAKKVGSELISDNEIKDSSNDLLDINSEAESFAKNVLNNNTTSSLVYGIDAPWGSGKTSFINLAEKYWQSSSDKVIVCRFEPLRYASEPNLANRLINELTISIQHKVFAPEFKPAASRYSRLVKGKANFSFLGFKISLTPSSETMDELLEDIDEVLRNIDYRVIIVIDDLDRLDTKAVNNILFATKQTFKLTRANYVFCYDTEVLTNNKEDNQVAREFLEKFVTVQKSLFINSKQLIQFLKQDKPTLANQFESIPADTMLKLSTIKNEMAEILNSELAPKYLPIVGNIRKIKRFMNATLFMKIQDSKLSNTDFNNRDLINLILLHLHYPGLFRRIYIEETEGLQGTFSLRRDKSGNEFINVDGFQTLLAEQDKNAQFLLKQLFEASTLDHKDISYIDQQIQRTRACFNSSKSRNLENYLNLIVLFTKPEIQKTFSFYSTAIKKVLNGTDISEILASSNFDTIDTHEEFWSMLVSEVSQLSENTAREAINFIIKELPNYPSLSDRGQGLRHRSIHSIILILAKANWAKLSDRHRQNTKACNQKIAQLIFGEKKTNHLSIIRSLITQERGAIGWKDLMLFRLLCSIARGGQSYNLYSALILDQDPNAETTGPVDKLELLEMRKISQIIFALFKSEYINKEINFLCILDETPKEMFLGDRRFKELNLENETIKDRDISEAKTSIKSFVIYQLSNKATSSRAGIGCGYYDEYGEDDNHNISVLMNNYLFDICFNPEVNEKNPIYFIDYCLSNFSDSYFTEHKDIGYVPTLDGLTSVLDKNMLAKYWGKYGSTVKETAQAYLDREVVSVNYIAFYKDDLDSTFEVLDKLIKEVNLDNVIH